MTMNKIANEIAYSMNQIMESPEHQALFKTAKLVRTAETKVETEKKCCDCKGICNQDCPCKKGKESCSSCDGSACKASKMSAQTMRQVIIKLNQTSELLDQLGLVKSATHSLKLISVAMKELHKKAETIANPIRENLDYGEKKDKNEVKNDHSKEKEDENDVRNSKKIEDEILNDKLFQSSPDDRKELLKLKSILEDTEHVDEDADLEEAMRLTENNFEDEELSEDRNSPDFKDFTDVEADPEIDSSHAYRTFLKGQDTDYLDYDSNEGDYKRDRDLETLRPDRMAVASLKQLKSLMSKYAEEHEDKKEKEECMDVVDVDYAKDLDQLMAKDQDWEDEE